MSKAFTRESDDAPESPAVFRPASVLPPGTKNYMTARGVQRFRDELIQSKEALTQMESPEPALSPSRAAVECRIQQLERILESAVAVPPATKDLRVRFGATVAVRAKSGDTSQYRIVGVDETDPDRDWVSWLSPVAKALTGRQVGDRVRIRLPSGELELEIAGILYED